MNEVGRLIISLILASVALTILGSEFLWSKSEIRRIRRSFRRVLGEAPHALLIAPGRGRGVGFTFTAGHLAVGWDCGAWCLIYRISELIGAELIVDGQVLARVHRGETRRPLDLVSGAEELVRLRLIFNDAAYPDFDLDLWLPEDATRKGALSASEAMWEANRWLARIEAMFRRPTLRRGPLINAEETAEPEAESEPPNMPPVLDAAEDQAA